LLGHFKVFIERMMKVTISGLWRVSVGRECALKGYAILYRSVLLFAGKKMLPAGFTENLETR